MDLNNLKDQIKDFELDFDQSEVWSKIEKEQNKGKRRIIFWLPFIFGALLLIVGVFHVVDSSAASKEKNHNQISANEIELKGNDLGQVDDQVEISSSIFSPDKAEYESKIEEGLIAEANGSKGISNQFLTNNINNNNVKISVATNQEIVNRRNVTNSNNGVAENKINGHNSSRNLISEIIEPSPKINISNKMGSKEVSSSSLNDKIRKGDNISDTSKGNAISISNDNMVIESQDDSHALLNAMTNSQSRSEIVIAVLRNEFLPVQLSYNYRVNVGENMIYSYNQIEPHREINNRNMIIKLVAEYGMLNRTLALSNNGINRQVLEERERSESAMDHGIIGVNLSMPLSKLFFINTGMEYHRMTDKLEYSKNAIRPLNQADLPDGLKDAHGFVISKSNSTYYNHIDLINIPIEVGARWSQSRISEFVSVGTSINLNSDNRQLYINEFENIEDSSNHTKTSLINSYVIKAGVAFSLLPELEWSLQASYRYTPNVTGNESDFDQSYQSYLIGTGLGYKF